MTEHRCASSCNRQTCKVFNREYMRQYRKKGPQVRGRYDMSPKAPKPPKPKPVVIVEPKKEIRTGGQLYTGVLAMTLEQYKRHRDAVAPVRFVEPRPA